MNLYKGGIRFVKSDCYVPLEEAHTGHPVS